jgi:hypothetical protein
MPRLRDAARRDDACYAAGDPSVQQHSCYVDLGHYFVSVMLCSPLFALPSLLIQADVALMAMLALLLCAVTVLLEHSCGIDVFDNIHVQLFDSSLSRLPADHDLQLALLLCAVTVSPQSLVALLRLNMTHVQLFDSGIDMLCSGMLFVSDAAATTCASVGLVVGPSMHASLLVSHPMNMSYVQFFDSSLSRFPVDMMRNLATLLVATAWS